MVSKWGILLFGFSAMACALVAGVFLAFSDFVMRALRKADPVAGVEAMQIINREVFKSLFMTLLVGMSVLAPLLAVVAYIKLSGPAAYATILSGAIYFIGVFGVTLALNVPMNMRLDAMDHASPSAQAYWAETFYPKWTTWNHVRTIAAAISAAGYMLACVWLAQYS